MWSKLPSKGWEQLEIESLLLSAIFYIWLIILR
jgi:hypothetical protein